MGHYGSKGHTQGFNRYSYVRNNPYKYIDPDGKQDMSSWYKARTDHYRSTGKTATEFSKDFGLSNLKTAKLIVENAFNPSKKVGYVMDVAEIAIEAIVKEDLPISEGAGFVTSKVTGEIKGGIEADFGSGENKSLTKKVTGKVVDFALGKVVDTMTQKAVEPIENMVEKEIK